MSFSVLTNEALSTLETPTSASQSSPNCDKKIEPADDLKVTATTSAEKVIEELAQKLSKNASSNTMSDKSAPNTQENCEKSRKVENQMAQKLTVVDHEMKNELKKKDAEKSPEVPTFTLKKPKGIAKWPEQKVEIRLKQGFQFNIMCIGETSCGKSTFIESLFDIRSPLTYTDHPSDKNFKFTSFSTADQNAPISINITFTKGMNFLPNDTEIENISNHIKILNQDYLDQETAISRPDAIKDKRIHLFIYFITAPIVLLTKEHTKLFNALKNENLLPVIAKSDTYLASERENLKKKFLDIMSDENVELFKFPERGTFAKSNAAFNSLIPFTIFGSVDLVAADNKPPVRARNYSYGMIEVDNPKHSEFSKFREAVVQCNLINLIHMTHHRAYNQFRSGVLKKMGITENDPKSIEKITAFITDMRKSNSEKVAQLQKEFDEFVLSEDRIYKNKEKELFEANEKKISELKIQIKENEDAIAERNGSFKSKPHKSVKK